MTPPAASRQSDVPTHVAGNYAPLPVVLAEGDGAWVTDIEGRRYLDFLSAYSAVNFGHRHPDLIRAATQQLERLTLASRAFENDQLAPFCTELAALIGKDIVLPMNTGAEAVESALKIARKWGHEVKGVPVDHATIVVMGGNFHGRTTTIVGFSDDADARNNFGPFSGGFVRIPYGEADALESLSPDNIVAILVEPIQGEAGVIVPPPDFLASLRQWCASHGALLIADEIQSGLARTGTTLACEHWNVEADLYLLGKALGGGVLPVSAVVGDRSVMQVLTPGTHGSTFGGNPLAAAVGREVVRMLGTGEWQRNCSSLGIYLHQRLRALVGQGITAVRGLGLWAGVDIDPRIAPAKTISLRLADAGLLTKDTHGQTLRLAPPLVVTREEIDWAVDALASAVA